MTGKAAFLSVKRQPGKSTDYKGCYDPCIGEWTCRDNNPWQRQGIRRAWSRHQTSWRKAVLLSSSASSTNENTNGLLREYFPKRKDITNYSDEYIAAVTDKINKRPRKCLGYKTPFEVYYSKTLHIIWQFKNKKKSFKNITKLFTKTWFVYLFYKTPWFYSVRLFSCINEIYYSSIYWFR